MSSVCGNRHVRALQPHEVHRARHINKDLILFLPFEQYGSPRFMDRTAYSGWQRRVSTGNNPTVTWGHKTHDFSGNFATSFASATSPGPGYPNARAPTAWIPNTSGGLKLANNDVIGNLDDLTFSFWVAVTSTTGSTGATDGYKGNPTIIDKGGGADEERDFFITYAGTQGFVQFVTGRPSSSSDHVLNASIDITGAGTPPHPMSDWHHVACVRRRSDGFKGIYIDGALDTSATNSAGWSMTNNYPMTIGSGTAGGAKFEGYLTYIMMWKSALSAEDIYSLWHPMTRFLELNPNRSIYRYPPALIQGDPLVLVPPVANWNAVSVLEA